MAFSSSNEQCSLVDALFVSIILWSIFQFSSTNSYSYSDSIFLKFFMQPFAAQILLALL